MLKKTHQIHQPVFALIKRNNPYALIKNSILLPYLTDQASSLIKFNLVFVQVGYLWVRKRLNENAREIKMLAKYVIVPF